MVIPKEWTSTTLGNISIISGKYGANAAACEYKEGMPRYIRITDIEDSGNLINTEVVSARLDDYSKYIVEQNDLLFARTGATTGKCYIHKSDGDFIYAGFLIKFRLDENLADPYYIWNFTKTNLYNNWVSIMSVRSGQPGINSQEYTNLKLLLPPLSEQKKIAEILSTWDDAISTKNKIIEFETRRKKAIVSKVYRGNLGKDPNNSSRFQRLKKYLSEAKKKNGKGDLSVLSVSNSKGFVLQEEQFDRVVASKDRSNYKVVEKDQFAYNPSRVNVGSIDLMVEFDKGILSPMYVVFKCQNGLESRYLYHFLKSDLFLQMIPKYTQGSVRDSLAFSGLTSMKMYIPLVQEQNSYINLLDSIDRKISLLNNEVQFLKKQKQGLMQQLLTGKIRVNVS